VRPVRKLIIILITHVSVGVFGFALGIYMLPIMIAPPAPSEAEIEAMSSQVQFTSQFRKGLEGSDRFHWGEGVVSISNNHITLIGELAPGPDYKLYLSPKYVETEASFERAKASMVNVGDVKTFNNFIVDIPSGVDPAQYNTVVVWCESFGEFITSAKYQ